MQELRNYYITTILKSKILLDEDLELILTNCKVLDAVKPISKFNNNNKWRALSALCFCGASLYRFRLIGLIVAAPLSIYFARKLYRDYTLKCYSNNIQLLIKNLSLLHNSNREILNYLKTKELFRIHENVSSLASTKNEHIYTIFKVEIALINYTMAVINRLCDINQITQPENWNIEDLHLDDYTSPEECQENFAKLHDIVILIVSKFLCCTAVTVSNANQSLVLDQIVPDVLKCMKERVKVIKNAFNSARSLSVLEKQFSIEEKKSSRPITKLRQPLSKLLTHLQLTFELAQQVYETLPENIVELENLNDRVFCLQEQIAICEQNLDQFCETYGILIKKSVTATKKQVDAEAESSKEGSGNRNVSAVVNNEDGEFEEGDQEYEMYVGEDSEEDSDEKTAIGYERDEDISTACLLMVLKELKVRLRERQIMRAKRLGLPLPEDCLQQCENQEPANVAQENTSTQVMPPLIQAPPPLPSYDLDFQQSFASVIKLAAQQRKCQEDTFQDYDAEDDSD